MALCRAWRCRRAWKKASGFPELLFTPTTKAEEGHDENMTRQQVIDMVGAEMAAKLEETSKAVFGFADEFASQRGIILADTKMEFGILDGELILIDELLTPDSSRFWDAEGYGPWEVPAQFRQAVCEGLAGRAGLEPRAARA